jgi:hypothetical protein
MATNSASNTNTALTNTRNTYLDLTHQFNNYNEIHSVNTFLKNANDTEIERLQNENDMLKARVLKIKQEYILKDRDANEYAFRTNIMMFTIVIVCIAFLLATFYMTKRMGGGLIGTLFGLLLVIYLLVVWFLVKGNAERRKYAYNQFYWLNMEKKTK